MHCLVLSATFLPFELFDLFLEVADKLSKRHVERSATLQNSIRRRDFAICLYFNLYFLLERMRFLVACKFDSGVLEQLISETVAKSVILVLDDNCSLETLL